MTPERPSSAVGANRTVCERASASPMRSARSSTRSAGGRPRQPVAGPARCRVSNPLHDSTASARTVSHPPLRRSPSRVRRELRSHHEYRDVVRNTSHATREYLESTFCQGTGERVREQTHQLPDLGGVTRVKIRVLRNNRERDYPFSPHPVACFRPTPTACSDRGRATRVSGRPEPSCRRSRPPRTPTSPRTREGFG